MVFPKVPDVGDVRAQALPLILTPYLIWAFIGDLWATTLEMTTIPLRADQARAFAELTVVQVAPVLNGRRASISLMQNQQWEHFARQHVRSEERRWS
jgi:hypothetical protein